MMTIKSFFHFLIICSLMGISQASYVPTSPPGVIIQTAATSCPSKTVPADGSSLVRSSYLALFTAIGVTYGNVDGTHFNVPNSKGVFLRGAGSQTISAISYTGTQGTTQGDQFQGHEHNVTYSAGTNLTTGAVDYVIVAGGSYAPTSTPISDGTNGTPRTGTETRPANISVLYCIYY